MLNAKFLTECFISSLGALNETIHRIVRGGPDAAVTKRIACGRAGNCSTEVVVEPNVWSRKERITTGILNLP